MISAMSWSRIYGYNSSSSSTTGRAPDWVSGRFFNPAILRVFCMSHKQNENALYYHEYPKPGKIEVTPTKTLSNQVDLSLAYSPGVAAPCMEIYNDPSAASRYTARSNLVAVITNGTAVLGLGDIGPLASKPVMEGKGVLFKKFGGIDVFDIEIDETDPDKFVDIVASLAPTFGGINLEDIKAPECFFIEKQLRDRIDIPVFHDDQHGTAIITAAGLINALKVADKKIDQVKLVASGAGAAGIACLDMLVKMGMKPENIYVTDSKGVIYKGRSEGMDERKARYANDTEARTLEEVIQGADVFLGVSRPGMLTQDMVCSMAGDRPIIFALANPVPEILPEEVKAVRPNAIIATGRSDYPNQVNNVLCFPYIFRGALDVGAKTINEEMKLACIKALSDLAMQRVNEEANNAYSGESVQFGSEYLIPRPFDPNLITVIPLAVAKAAMESGVATKPIKDFNAYRAKLERFVYRTGMLMRPIFESARQNPKKVVYAEGEKERVLRAVQEAVQGGLCEPILIGRPDVIQYRIQDLGLSLKQGKDYQCIDPDHHPHYEECWNEYWQLRKRKGVSPALARMQTRTSHTSLAALLLRLGHADAMICGTTGRYHKHLNHLIDILDLQDGVKMPAAMNALLLPKGVYFFCDTNVHQNPTAEELVEMTLLAASEVKRFGITPKVAMLSNSNFGSANTEESRKLATAVAHLHKHAPNLEVEGEMQADLAIYQELREEIMPESMLNGSANLFIMPNIASANISFNLVKSLGEGHAVGPILMGMNKPAHILTPHASVRRILNMTALSTVECQRLED